MANVALKNWCRIHNTNAHAKLDCPQFHLAASIFNVDVQASTSKFLVPKGNEIVPSGYDTALVLETFTFREEEDDQLIENEPYFCENLYPETTLVLNAFQFLFETKNEVLYEIEEAQAFQQSSENHTYNLRKNPRPGGPFTTSTPNNFNTPQTRMLAIILLY